MTCIGAGMGGGKCGGGMAAMGGGTPKAVATGGAIGGGKGTCEPGAMCP